MEKILKLNVGIVFILILIGMVLRNFIFFEDPITASVFSIIGLALYFIYPLCVGYILHDHLPKKVELSLNYFLINFFVFILAFSIVALLAREKLMHFEGIYAIIAGYVLFAFLYTSIFPAKVLKSIEMNKQVSFSEYYAEFFMFFFLPIGIWFIIPRVQKIMDEKNQVSLDGFYTDNIKNDM